MSDFDENSMDFYEPVNFTSLAKDIEYANTIVALKRLYTIQLNQLNKTRRQIQDTLTMISEEINELNKM